MMDTKAFIASAKQNGMSDDAIRSALLSMGVDATEVYAVLPVGAENVAAAQNATPNVSVSANAGVAVSASGSVPDSNQDGYIGRWSWGAFLMGWIYFAASRMGKRAVGYFFAMFLGPIFLVFAIMAGLNGRKKVWASGKWPDFESYKKRQKTLDIVAITLFAISILVPATMFIFSPEGEVEPLTNQIQITETATSTSAGGEPDAGVTTTTSVAISVQDCGSVSGDVLFSQMFGPGDALSNLDTAVLTCADQAFINCTPSKFSVIDKNGQASHSEVLGVISGECQFYRGNYSGERATCRILSGPFQEIRAAYLSDPKTPAGALSAFIATNADAEAAGTSGDGEAIVSCGKFSKTQ